MSSDDRLRIPSNSQLIVFDGITTPDQMGSGIQFSKTNPICQFIAVASLQFYIPEEELNRFGLNKISCNGWTLEEYKLACNDQNFMKFVSEKFFQQETLKEENNLEEILEEKFFFAGHSARYMFNFTIEQTLSDIHSNLNRIDSVDQLFKGLLGDASQTAVNHLFSKIDSKPVLVSQYVARELAKRNYENF